jgi:uncharacterized protein (UPF0264 family)
MPELLVSVRSAAEARAALEGGAGLIDVKEPGHGSLGRASDETVQAVLREVAGRRPVSAALGEFRECRELPATAGLRYVKWGLAGCDGDRQWETRLGKVARHLEGRLVAVAYADWRRAAAPSPDAVCAFACAANCGAYLLDTWRKDETTLLNWLSPGEIGGLRQRCRQAGVRVALAGRLGLPQIEALRPAQPDWFAVRGAVCQGGRRDQVLDAEAVRCLADSLRRG